MCFLPKSSIYYPLSRWTLATSPKNWAHWNSLHFCRCFFLLRQFLMQQFGKIWVESKQSSYLCCPWVSGNSRSRLFTGMKASGSCSPILGMECFIPFLFPNLGNGFFHSLPVPEFREWIFSIPFPFPNFGNGFFPFPSRSRISGMDFFHSLPVPELTLSKSGIKRENGRF